MNLLLLEDESLLLLETLDAILLEQGSSPAVPYTQGTGAQGLSNYITMTLIPSVIDIRPTNIFNYEPTDLQGFPAATITLQELPGRVLDNSRNEHIFRFTIRIFIERTKQNFGVAKAENILRSTVANLISQVDGDTTLGGNCIIARAFNAKFGYIDSTIKDIRLCEVTLDCIDANTYK